MEVLMSAMRLFTVATLLPLPPIIAAALYGGIWAVIAPLTMTVMVAVLDEVVRVITPPTPESEFPAADHLSVVVVIGQFAMLGAVVYGISSLSWAEAFGVFVAAGLYLGQVANSNAHELIHRQSRLLRKLGVWAYISVLYGQHASAHVLVHHPLVATRSDPNSARYGESFYKFAGRAWRGEFRKGLEAERDRMARSKRPRWRNPYVTYLLGAALMLLIARLIGGTTGLLWYVALAIFAQVQLLMSDYVQHYGLERKITDGKPEPIAARHSWNSPHWYSSALMLNAPRHSDHHAHPMRPYPALELPNAPTLPRSIPVMACIALLPPMWRKVMHPRLKEWRKGSFSKR